MTERIRMSIGGVCMCAGIVLVLGAEGHPQLPDLLLQAFMGLGLIAIGAVWLRD